MYLKNNYIVVTGGSAHYDLLISVITHQSARHKLIKYLAKQTKFSALLVFAVAWERWRNADNSWPCSSDWWVIAPSPPLCWRHALITSAASLTVTCTSPHSVTCRTVYWSDRDLVKLPTNYTLVTTATSVITYIGQYLSVDSAYASCVNWCLLNRDR